MRKILSWLPNWRPSLLAVLFGLVLAWLFTYDPKWHSAEAAIWSVVNHLGWFWWGIPIATSIIGLYYIAMLTPEASRYGWATRFILIVGFWCYCFSWANTALGPIGAILVPIGTVMLIRQLAQACIAARKTQPKTNEPFGKRVLYMLVPHHNQDWNQNG